MDQEMTVDRRPEQNGHAASGHVYDKPGALGHQGAAPRPRRVRLRVVQLAASAVLAVALAIVVRRVVEAPEE